MEHGSLLEVTIKLYRSGTLPMEAMSTPIVVIPTGTSHASRHRKMGAGSLLATPIKLYRSGMLRMVTLFTSITIILRMYTLLHGLQMEHVLLLGDKTALYGYGMSKIDIPSRSTVATHGYRQWRGHQMAHVLLLAVRITLYRSGMPRMGNAF